MWTHILQWFLCIYGQKKYYRKYNSRLGIYQSNGQGINVLLISEQGKYISTLSSSSVSNVKERKLISSNSFLSLSMFQQRKLEETKLVCLLLYRTFFLLIHSVKFRLLPVNIEDLKTSLRCNSGSWNIMTFELSRLLRKKTRKIYSNTE